MLRLVVNADDFGLTQGINNGIVAAHRKGILTSASMMACGKAFDHAIDLLSSVPQLDLGVHLTLVEENPIEDCNRIPSLVTTDGNFKPSAASFTRDYFRGRINPREVILEFESQIKKLAAAGISISHIDSHQHIHMLPGIFRIVTKIAWAHHIPIIRVPYERIKGYMLRRPAMVPRLVQLMVLNYFCRRANLDKRVTTDHFVGFFHSGRLTTNALKLLLSGLPDTGYCELICHPGWQDQKSPYRHWNYTWDKEFEALTDPDIKMMIKTNQIDLSSFSALADKSKR